VTRVRLICLALLVGGTWAVLPSPAAAASIPSPSCNGSGCGGWFRSNVTVSWSYDAGGVSGASGCGSTTVTEDTTGTTITCTITLAAGGFMGNSVSVKKDSTPPSVEASFARAADVDGWYTSPVAVSFSGDGGPSGISSCTSGTYGGPDGADVKVSGSCTDGAGNVGSTSLSIRYDATAPTVKPVPERPPDADGWYNHPVKIAFSGEDGGAGVTQCTAPATYSGPDADPAHVVGQCRDGVGHLSAPVSFDLRYDATKPAQPKLRASRGSGTVTLSWTSAADAVRAEVVRSPGTKGKKAAVVYSGKARRVVDERITAGARYWYQVRLFDRAGNVSSRTLAVKPTVGILVPAPGAVLRRAPLVRWAPVKKARFYNVQLWRKRVKVMTTWPSGARLRLNDTWRFAGKQQRLTEGPYQLYVWPAFGTLADPRYGKLVGRVNFVVRRGRAATRAASRGAA
jgi:hypothetical protein